MVSVIVLNNVEAAGMYQACKREGHKARVKFIPGGKAVVIHARLPGTYQEVGQFARIRLLSKGEHSTANSETVSRLESRSRVPFASGAQIWVSTLTAALAGACVIVVSCLAFGE
jgi:hypothetical protein